MCEVWAGRVLVRKSAMKSSASRDKRRDIKEYVASNYPTVSTTNPTVQSPRKTGFWSQSLRADIIINYCLMFVIACDLENGTLMSTKNETFWLAYIISRGQKDRRTK